MLLRRFEEVDALYCFFLGRRIESIDRIAEYINISIFEAIHKIIISTEFGTSIVSVSKRDTFNLGRLSIQELHNIIDLLCRSQILRSNDVPDYICRSDIEDSKDSLSFLYWEIFRRPPDYDGLLFHRSAIERGATLVELADVLKFSAEGQSRDFAIEYIDGPHLPREQDCNQQYVEMVYAMILDRPADPSGLRHHLGALMAGDIDRNSFIEDMVTSVEAQAIRRQRPSGAAITWKEPVASIYRRPSLVRAVGLMDTGSAERLMSLLEHCETPTQSTAPQDVKPDRGRPSAASSSAALIYQALI